MTLQSLNVRDIRGKEAQIQVVDADGGAWGNIGVGRITFSDTPAVSGALETLEDYGTMGLALLGEPAEFATAAGGEKGPVAESVADASTPLGEKLVGALGRKLSLSAGESAVVTFALMWNFPNLKTPGQGRYYATRFRPPRPWQIMSPRIKRRTMRRRSSGGTIGTIRPCPTGSSTERWPTRRFSPPRRIPVRQRQVLGLGGRGMLPGHMYSRVALRTNHGRLFPELDILLRERTDLNPDDSFAGSGMVASRGKGSGPAIDGQAGIVLRCLRDHQVSPDDKFLKRNWPKIKKAIEWLIEQDGTGDGVLKKHQHNTLDAEWYGEVAWLTSGLYLAALRAGEEMAGEMGEPGFAAKCRTILAAGRKNFVAKMWNGEYFIQVGDPKAPKAVGSYDGCEIDQVFGQSWAYQVGLGQVLPQAETRQALKSLWRYNFTPDVGPYRAKYQPGRWYALAGEAGLLMCSWPKGEDKRVRTGFDFYFNECMTGFEHQVAGHMIWENMLLEGLAIERAIHDRYDASRRNPWNEVECGDHYARAMASYGVFLAACGFEYHGPKGHIGFAPRLTPDKFKAAFTAAEGWGSFSQSAKDNELSARIEVKSGKLKLKSIALAPVKGAVPRTATTSVNGKAVDCQLEIKDGKLVVTLAADTVVNAGESLDVVIG